MVTMVWAHEYLILGYITISLYSRIFSVFKRNQNQSGKKGNSWPFSQDLPLE